MHFSASFSASRSINAFPQPEEKQNFEHKLEQQHKQEGLDPEDGRPPVPGSQLQGREVPLQLRHLHLQDLDPARRVWPQVREAALAPACICYKGTTSL
jgi:hypothetical protein